MNPSEVERAQAVISAITSTPAWAAAMTIFWCGAALMALLIHRKNRFGLRDTALSIVGLKRFERTAAINITNIVMIVVPMLLMAWATTAGK